MLEILTTLIALIFFIPVAMFAIEVLVGIFPSKPAKNLQSDHDISAVILIPAHNEEEVLANTLDSVSAQLSNNDDIIVIADNCNDKTHEIAQSYNCIALERFSDTERGKGYALDYGVQFIQERNLNPDIVIIVDADCLLENQAIQHLKTAAYKKNLPIQSCYLMKSGEEQRLSIKISEFAFMVKNKIRLRGLRRLGCPVPLTGTGMAFPWALLKEAKLATGDIVEDMRLGVELTEKGQGPSYCDQARVFSFFPTSESAEKTQNERWEHGHLSTIKTFVPRLLKHALTHFKYTSLGAALDLLIPPLSLLILLITSLAIVFGTVSLIIGNTSLTLIFASYLFTILIAVALAWLCHGKHILSLKDFAYIPIYIISKIGLYLRFFYAKQTKWIRTDRK